ncbi:cation-transporting ATPase [Helicobacter pametensis]|nr:cation-transporting ATPase [Helicobacter pametensis]
MSHTESQANTCFYCGLPVPRGLDLPIEFEGVCHPACCAGCQAVVQLGSYYSRRTAEAEQAVPPPEVLEQLKLYELPDIQAEFVEVKAENEREAVLILGGITCAACVWLIGQQPELAFGFRQCLAPVAAGKIGEGYLKIGMAGRRG